MELLTLPDAASTAGVSLTTLRNYIHKNRLRAYKKANRTLVERGELLALFGLKPVARPATGARVLAIANQKGGVGKTTTAVALAAILARDAPVLALDCDPQGNMTQAFGIDPDIQEPTLYHTLVEELPLEETLVRIGPPPPDLWLVPANLDLADTSRRVAGKVGLETLLRTALQPLRERFGYIVIDCPPSLDLITLNALVAASEVIVPVDMSVFSVRGMVKLFATMQEVRKVNPELLDPRIVACRTDNTTVSQTIEERIRESFPGKVFNAAIPRGKDIPAAHAARTPLPYHAPQSRTAEAYEALAEEVRRG
jgi:chromosome partitioning protein